jgi:hypothetical protein
LRDSFTKEPIAGGGDEGRETAEILVSGERADCNHKKISRRIAKL